MLRVAAFVLAIIVVGNASAVDLGTLTLRSGYAEPLQAVLPLENPDNVRLGAINIEPASALTYERLGIDRPAVTGTLTTELRGSGDVVLRSDASVSADVIDLVLVVTWPSGRVVRDYVITLEPPVFTDEPRRALRRFEPDVLNDPGAPESDADADPLQGSRQTAGEAEQSAADPPEGAMTYTVADSDTLWQIARSVRTDPDHTPQQIMLALQDLNPAAFINGNINRLRADSTLRMPSASDIESRSVREAIAEVARQNAASAVDGSSDDTSAAEPAGELESPVSEPAEPDRDPDGFLEVVTETTDSAEDADTEGEAATEIRRLQNELAIQEEVNDELRRQYEDQQSRLLELEEQVQLLDRLVELQSQSATELQALAGELSEPDATTATETTDSIASTSGGLSGQIGRLWRAVREWLQQPLNAGLVVAALVVALVLVLLMRRRQDAGEIDPEPHDGDLEIDDSLLEDHEDLVPGSSEPTVAESDSSTQAGATRVTEMPSGRNVPEVIENADMHMAFQNFGEAEQVLREALAHNPGETALALRLLHLFAETGERTAFEAAADEYAGSQSDLEPLYRKLADTEVRVAGEPAPPNHRQDVSDNNRRPEGKSENDDELLSALDDLMDDIDQGEFESSRSGEVADTADERRPVDTDSPEPVPADDWDKDFDFLDGDDEMDTKLDLARAYMDMGDQQGAREILQEVVAEGSSTQRASAEELLGHSR